MSVFFSESDRQVYSCPVTGMRFDPLAVKRTIAAASRSRFNDLCADARSDDPAKREAAVGGIVAAGRAAFNLKPIDPKTGEGVLDAVVYDAVIAFTKWLKGKGEGAQGMPNSAPCSGCP